MSVRIVAFWIHLAAGLCAGVVILIMSVTGIAIAFEEEIRAWRDGRASRITAKSRSEPPLTMVNLKSQIEGVRPGVAVASIALFRDPSRALEFYLDNDRLLYVDPHTGTAVDSPFQDSHEIFHKLEEWHRWLGDADGGASTGRLVTGICNLALVVLCITGLYLWFPRRWTWRVLRPLLVLKLGSKGKARDFNWHAVFGFWSLPGVLVLSVTAVAISFEWGHRLVFQVLGEEPPKSRNYGMMSVPAPVVPTPAPGAERLPLEAMVEEVRKAFPDWESITLEDLTQEANSTEPLEMGVTIPDRMPSRAYIPVKSDPFTGAILQAVRFEERSAGLQARIWMRFLHTGGAFGLPGKIIASLASAACTVLVWTGFSLSWRRFFAWRRRGARSPPA